MKFFLFISLFIILVFLVSLKIIDNIFSQKDYYIILQIFLVGLMINIVLILFLTMVFRNMEIKKGPRGAKGSVGIKGFTGNPEYCAECNKIPITLGSNKSDYDKKNNIIVSTPMLD